MAFFPKITTTFIKHIETVTIDGQLHRVYRPFREWEYFIMPIVSVEDELSKDRARAEHIRINGEPLIPTPNSYMDGDELMEYHNDTSMSNLNLFTEQETTS